MKVQCDGGRRGISGHLFNFQLPLLKNIFGENSTTEAILEKNSENINSERYYLKTFVSGLSWVTNRFSDKLKKSAGNRI